MNRRLIPLSEHVPGEIAWLWQGRIPFGGITLLEGDPGGNKSSLVYDIAARLTTGRAMYDCAGNPAPAAAILLQAEDAVDTMRRNLEVAGADLAKVFVIERSLAAAEGSLSLPEDLDFVAAEVERRQAKLLVIDPITAFARVNINNDQAIRKITGPLTALAERKGLAILLVRHLTKSGGVNPLYRGAGSIGLVGAARSGLLVGSDPGDPRQRVLAPTKCSLGGRSPSLSFRPVANSSGLMIEWLGQSNYSAVQLLEAGRVQSRSELAEATYVLYSILADGPLPASEAKQTALGAGIADRTLRRAKEVLQVISQRKGFGKGSVFFWTLPPKSEIVARLHDRDMDELLHKLCYGDANAGPAFPAEADPKADRSGEGKSSDDDPDATSASS